jgi:HlyD family secretion protein
MDLPVKPANSQQPAKPGKPAKKKKSNFSGASLGRHALVGLLASVVMFGGLGVWAATTDIASAVVASGLVVVEGGSKKVQHQEGGIIKEIFAFNEDRVEAGELLIRLDGTTIQANLAVVMSQLSEALARQARLTAESISAGSIEFPEVLESFPDQAELKRLFEAQEKLRVSRLASIEGQTARMDEQVAQIEQQIIGLEAQQSAIGQQLEIVNAESADLDELFAQGLVQISRVNDIKREQSRLIGEQGRIFAEIASSRAAIAERQVVNAQVVDDFQSQVLTDLQDVGVTVAELLQQKIAAEDRLARLEIRAPQSGVIHESIVQTVGGVAGAGETLMLIVPEANELLIDARVSPLDVDKIFVSQDVTVRLSSLNTRTTPELFGSVRSIAPDLTMDRVTGQQYFLVRIEVPDDEVARLPEGIELGPGMPADIFAQTGDNTVLNYLMRPLTDQFQRTFREE